MSIIHFDTMTASGADSSGLLQYPLGGWVWSAGNGGPSAESVAVLMYGEGEAGPAGFPGEWAIYDFGILEASAAWLTNDGAGIEDWMFRTTNITESTGDIPGTVYTGAWDDGRTAWIGFGTGTGLTGITTDTTPTWTASDSYGGSPNGVFGQIEFSLYPRDTTVVTFDAADVNTGTDRITVTGHPFSTGDQAVYIIPGGETGIGSTPGIVNNQMIAIYVVDANTIELGVGALAAVDDTLATVNITSTGTGTGHILRRINPATPSGGGSNTVNLSANT